jgi:hypothetical protein
MILYVVTVSGFALNLHYCFNRLSSVRVDAPANACVKALEVNKMKCCKYKHIEIKVKDAHQNGSPLFWSKFFPLALPLTAFAYFSPAIQNTPNAALPERGPPSAPDVPLFLRHCIFRI